MLGWQDLPRKAGRFDDPDLVTGAVYRPSRPVCCKTGVTDGGRAAVTVVEDDGCPARRAGQP
jgi:hypothetical protein